MVIGRRLNKAFNRNNVKKVDRKAKPVSFLFKTHECLFVVSRRINLNSFMLKVCQLGLDKPNFNFFIFLF